MQPWSSQTIGRRAENRQTSSSLIRLGALIWSLYTAQAAVLAPEAPPEPPIWPETFHAVAVQNRSGSLALVDLYYEWGKGRNANLIHSQLGTTLYDIE